MKLCICLVILLILPIYADVWVETDWSDTTLYTSSGVNGWRSPGMLLMDAPNTANWFNTADLANAQSITWLTRSQTGSIYASGDGAGGCIYETIDGGISWNSVGVSPPTSAVLWELLELSDTSLLVSEWMNTRVFRSTDGGSSWLLLGTFWLGMSGGPPHLLEVGPDTICVGLEAIGGPFGTVSIYRSTDYGATWCDSILLQDNYTVASFLQCSDGALYCGSSGIMGPSPARIYKSVDRGLTWTPTTPLPSSVNTIYSIIEGPNNTIYASSNNYLIFYSNDGGNTWNSWSTVGIGMQYIRTQCYLDNGWFCVAGANTHFAKTLDGVVWDSTGNGLITNVNYGYYLLQDADGTLYLGTGNTNGDVFKAGYFLTGYLNSRIYNTGDNQTYGIMSWNDSLNSGVIQFKVRTDTLPDMSTAMDWALCPYVTNGQDISGLASVQDGDRYIQYRVEMGTIDPNLSPALFDVSIEYTILVIYENISEKPVHSYFLIKPNLALSKVNISFGIPQRQRVELVVFDIKGCRIKTLCSGIKEAGRHLLVWNIDDESGQRSTSGVYFLQLETEEFNQTKKVVLLD